MRKANVFYKEKLCGTLIEKDEGYYFSYDHSYLKFAEAKPISLLFPLTTNEYFSSNLFPFFDNLIPEGWLLGLYSTKFSINKTDRFSLLLKLGDEPVGAVSIREANL